MESLLSQAVGPAASWPVTLVDFPQPEGAIHLPSNAKPDEGQAVAGIVAVRGALGRRDAGVLEFHTGSRLSQNGCAQATRSLL